MEIKINQQKQFSPSGCVYQRGFKINSTILSGFLNHLEKAQQTKEYPRSLYLKSKFEELDYKKQKLLFMNLTQTDLFIEFMRKNKLEFNENRAKLKANGYLEITK